MVAYHIDLASNLDSMLCCAGLLRSQIFDFAGNMSGGFTLLGRIISTTTLVREKTIFTCEVTDIYETSQIPSLQDLSENR